MTTTLLAESSPLTFPQERGVTSKTHHSAAMMIPMVSQSEEEHDEDTFSMLASSPSPEAAPRIRRSPRLSVLHMQPLVQKTSVPRKANRKPLLPPCIESSSKTAQTSDKENLKMAAPKTKNVALNKLTSTPNHQIVSNPSTSSSDPSNTLVGIVNQRKIRVRVSVGETTVNESDNRLSKTKDELFQTLQTESTKTDVSAPAVEATSSLVAVWRQKEIKVRLSLEPVIEQALAVDTTSGDEAIPTTLTPTGSATNTPTNQSTAHHSESLLKSLLEKTKRDLKEDGTPVQPKERRVYDDDEDDDDEPKGTTEGSGDSEMINTLLPSVSISQPSSPMAAPRTHKLPTAISVTELNQRMHYLFPELVDAKEGKNCVVARLFACFSLDVDAKQAKTPSPRKRPRREAAVSAKPPQVSLDPFLSVLNSLVQLEVALLHGEQDLKVAHRNRRVAFCAYDGSALQPPSDVIEDSHAHKQAELDGLAKVMGCLSELQNSVDMEDALSLFRQLVEYLEYVFPASGHALACAHSLSYRFMDFPVPRILKAAERYAKDLHQLTQGAWKTRPLTWQCRLADASAQMVRYWLRTELNPVPDRAPCEEYSNQWNLRVCDLILLEAPKGVSGDSIETAIDDGCLSSLVSNAASHICYAFGCNWKDWKLNMEQVPENFYGETDLTRMGIAPSTSNRRRSGVTLRQYTEDDWYQAGERLEEATSFLAAVNGAQFLYDLLTIVIEYPDYEQSWKDTIQESATRLDSVQGVGLQEQDRHLILLRYAPRDLREQLPLLIHHTKQRAAQEFLQHLAKKCLLGQTDANAKRRKRAYQPDLASLEASWEWCMGRIHFPTVTEYFDEAEEDDSEQVST